MFKLTSNKIQDFPFEDYSTLKGPALEELAKQHRLVEYNSWMLPQIVANIASWQLQYTSSGKICGQQTLKHNCTTAWSIGLWRVITQLKRSSLVKQQIQNVNYSALVPIYLSAHKRYNGISYSSWHLDENSSIVEPQLLAAMLWRGCGANQLQLGIDPRRLVALRECGIPAVEGPRGNPISNWCLRNMRDTELASAPKLVGTMLTQIWVAHPSLRTQYMVLDPVEWDTMPPPLISTNLFQEQQQSPKTTNTINVPWL